MPDERTHLLGLLVLLSLSLSPLSLFKDNTEILFNLFVFLIQQMGSVLKLGKNKTKKRV
jgi:hypothetical protein